MQGRIVTMIIILVIATNSIYSQIPKKENKSQTAQTQYSYQILNNPDSTFGYKILAESKPIINQPHIPAVAGNKGFVRKVDAERMADLVIKKINQGIMPPTVSVAEVDSIKAIGK